MYQESRCKEEAARTVGVEGVGFIEGLGFRALGGLGFRV